MTHCYHFGGMNVENLGTTGLVWSEISMCTSNRPGLSRASSIISILFVISDDEHIVQLVDTVHLSSVE